jgi:hypothetical protein
MKTSKALLIALAALFVSQPPYAKIRVGSNYVMTDLGDLLQDPNSWYGNNGKKPV